MLFFQPHQVLKIALTMHIQPHVEAIALLMNDPFHIQQMIISSNAHE